MSKEVRDKILQEVDDEVFVEQVKGHRESQPALIQPPIWHPSHSNSQAQENDELNIELEWELSMKDLKRERKKPVRVAPSIKRIVDRARRTSVKSGGLAFSEFENDWETVMRKLLGDGVHDGDSKRKQSVLDLQRRKQSVLSTPLQQRKQSVLNAPQQQQRKQSILNAPQQLQRKQSFLSGPRKSSIFGEQSTPQTQGSKRRSIVAAMGKTQAIESFKTKLSPFMTSENYSFSTPSEDLAQEEELARVPIKVPVNRKQSITDFKQRKMSLMHGNSGRKQSIVQFGDQTRPKNQEDEKEFVNIVNTALGSKQRRQSKLLMDSFNDSNIMALIPKMPSEVKSVTETINLRSDKPGPTNPALAHKLRHAMSKEVRARARDNWILAIMSVKKLNQATNVFKPKKRDQKYRVINATTFPESSLGYLLKSFQSKGDVVLNTKVQLLVGKNPNERTEEQMLELDRLLSTRLPAFAKFTPKQRMLMCYNMKYIAVEQGRAVIKEGHVGKSH